MHGTLNKWLLFTFLAVFLTVPIAASAQGEIEFNNLTVQLWPEFDQPAMLVIYDFTLTESTSLPVDVNLRFPKDANIIAVAYQDSSGLLNAAFQGPVAEGDWQVLTVTVDTKTTYRIEYYAPLTISGTQRDYAFLWPGDYGVETFDASVRVPVDTTDITTDPVMTETSSVGSEERILAWTTSGLKAGKQIPITLTYNKTSEQLSAAGQPIQAGTVDESTQGRVSLSNYLPYILGGFGIVLIAAGGLYFWQTSQGKPEARKRHRTRSEDDEGGDVYCSQCGNRTKAGDRFCRSCGTRLRKDA